MIAMRGQEPGFVLMKFLYETPVKTYSTYECFIANLWGTPSVSFHT